MKKSTLIAKLTNWDITVAAAEPATPQPSARMNTASSTMLRVTGMTQIRREYTFLPSARIMEEKPVEKTLPAKITVKYVFACGARSPVAPIPASNEGIAANPTAVTTAAVR